MKLGRRTVFALPLALLMASPALAAGASSWDGRWVGSWGGSQPTAQIVKGGKLVAYEFNGQVHPVAASRVTATTIVYGGDNGTAVVTITRTGPNTAHATIKAAQGEGSAELTRQ